MLRRATSWREKQQTAECHAALLKTRSIILKAISIDYEDVSCETQSNEFTGQAGAVSVSVSLDPGEQLATGAASQDCCAVCAVGTEQPDNTIGQCRTFVGQSGTLHTSPSEPLDLARGEETCSVVQAGTSQGLAQQLSLLGRANRWLQTDVGVSESNYDSDSTAYFSPCVPLTPPVPTEHQQLENTRVSAEADGGVVLKVAEELLLADEVCEVEGGAEQCTEVRMGSGSDDSVIYIYTLPID
jgi:hypothetical protein